MNSFSKETKEYLKTLEEKKKCCARTFSDVSSLSNETEEKRLSVLCNAPLHFKCSGCFPAFVKGLFISFGNITDPDKSYHLELSFKTQAERNAVDGIFFDNGFEMSKGERRGKFLLYVKSSSKIEDFFALMGANKPVFDLMNSKIVKDLNSQANRQINCDMANIRKTIQSAKPYIDKINELKEKGYIVRLTADLKETAKLRVEYPQMSMSDLALLHKPPISKSGVKHRLDKIMEIDID